MVDLELLNGYAADFYQIVLPVLLFSLAIVGYALIIGLSYKIMSRRDIFSFKRIKKAKEEYGKHSIFGFLLRLLEYGIVFPLLTIIWFAILSILLFVLSKELSVEALLTISVALVAATRVLSYFNEGISGDVAKLFPLILLGAFLLEPSFFSMELLYSRIDALPALLPKLVHFLAVPILVEWILRILVAAKNIIIPEAETG